MKKSDFDKALSLACLQNNFRVDGDFIEFDNKANLEYEVVPGITLNNLLTKNPVSFTRLNKNLLFSLKGIVEAFKKPVKIRCSYQSPEYSLLSFGVNDSELYKTGCALSLGVSADDLGEFIDCVDQYFKPGEVGFYDWGVHIGWSKEVNSWDKRGDTSTLQKVKNFYSHDSMKNVAIIAVCCIGGFFLIKKLF